jgi:hypothetical protein
VGTAVAIKPDFCIQQRLLLYSGIRNTFSRNVRGGPSATLEQLRQPGNTSIAIGGTIRDFFP